MHQHRVTVLWDGGLPFDAAAPHHTFDLRGVVLQRKVEMPRTGFGEIGYFPFHPHVLQLLVGFNYLANVGSQFGDVAAIEHHRKFHATMRRGCETCIETRQSYRYLDKNDLDYTISATI